MSEKSPFEDAVEYLRNDDRFRLILTDIAAKREDAITDLALYETATELTKTAAKVTVYTEFLDTFGVPMGEAAS